MLFNFSSTASLLALCALSSAASLKHKRATKSGVTLYAYGENANGGPVFYADGLAYIGTTGYPTWADVATNITFTVDEDDTTVPWTITANSSDVTFNSTQELYIIPTNDTLSQVGFTNGTGLPSGAVTTGFAFMGTSVAYVESDSNWEQQFWANGTEHYGFFALYWNGGVTTVPDGFFPITLKTTAPISLSGLTAM